MKVYSEKIKTFYYLNPSLAALITCVDSHGYSNIITVAWHASISAYPPLYGVSISPKRHSHNLILDSGEFVVNFASFEILDKVHYCGKHSGRDVNKFEETGFTSTKATRVGAPLIQECYAHLECRLWDHRVYGDHLWFVGEVISVDYDEEALHPTGLLRIDEISPIYYLGSNTYTTIDKNRRVKL